MELEGARSEGPIFKVAKQARFSANRLRIFRKNGKVTGFS